MSASAARGVLARGRLALRRLKPETGCAPWGLVAGPAPMRGTTAGGALPAGVAFMGVSAVMHARAVSAAGRVSARRGSPPPRSH